MQTANARQRGFCTLPLLLIVFLLSQLLVSMHDSTRRRAHLAGQRYRAIKEQPSARYIFTNKKEEGLRYPDWGLLKNRFDSELGVGQDGKRTEKIANSLYLDRDYRPSNDVIVEGVERHTLHIAIRGEFRQKNRLILRAVKNARIQIIAAGAVSVHKIELEDSRGATLLLYSATSSVEISSHDERLSLCQAKTNPENRLAVEAARGAIVSGRKLNSRGYYGCEMKRSAVIWPNSKLIGQLRHLQ